MRHTQGRQYTSLATNGLAGASLSTANVKANTVDFTPVLQVCGRKTLTVHLHCLLFLLWVMKQKMINNLKRNNKNKTHSLLSKGWKSRKVGSSMMATNPMGPLIPAMNWLYMHLKDICSRHSSSSYSRLGKHFLPLAHLLPGCCIMHCVPHWVEPRSCCRKKCRRKWGQHPWYFLKGSPCDSYYQYPTSSFFPFAVLFFTSFFSLSSVFTVLWIVMWLPSIGEPWELAGNEWLACKSFFVFFSFFFYFSFLKTTLASHQMKKIHSSASSYPVPVSGYLKLSEKWYGGRLHQTSVTSCIFSLHIENKKTLSSLFCPDLTQVKHPSLWHKCTL